MNPQRCLNAIVPMTFAGVMVVVFAGVIIWAESGEDNPIHNHALRVQTTPGDDPDFLPRDERPPTNRPPHKFEGLTLRNGLPDDPIRLHNDGVLVVHEAFEVRHADSVATNWTTTNLVLVTPHKPVVTLTTNGWEVRLAVGVLHVPDPTFDEGAVFGSIATRRNPDVGDFATIIKLATQLRALEVQRLQGTQQQGGRK